MRPSQTLENNGTHELGPPKRYKNNGTHDPGAIFLEPESCVPLISRAGIVRTSTFLEKFLEQILFFTHSRKFLEKMTFSDPFVGETTAGPKKVKNYK